MQRIISLLLLSLLCFAASSEARVLTPTNKNAFRFEPDILPRGGGSFGLAAIVHGYSVTSSLGGTPGTTQPSVGMDDYAVNIRAGNGLVFIGSHGDVWGFRGEVYENSPAGKTARDHNYNFYLGQGLVDGVDIVRAGDTSWGWGIGYLSAKATSMFTSYRSIVHVMVCKGYAYAADWGASLSLGYDFDPTQYIRDANGFWNKLMDGSAASAASLGDMKSYGTRNIALSEWTTQAARTHGFAVVAGVARWNVASEYKTAHYRIESASRAEGPWTVVQENIPAGAGDRSFTVQESGERYYRLMEVELDGDEIMHAVTRSVERVRPRNDVPELSLEELRAEMQKLHPRTEQMAQSTGQKVVVYTSLPLANEVRSSYVDYREQWHLDDVELVTIEQFPSHPDALRSAIKSDMATRYTEDEVEFFVLAGDANDYREFTGELSARLWNPATGWDAVRASYLSSGYPAAGQPELDIIPTFYIPDTETEPDESIGYYTPYVPSDQFYSDLDDDGSPDVVVTRMPFGTPEEFASFGVKLRSSAYVHPGVEKAAFLKGDVSHDGPDHGLLARVAADAVEQVVREESVSTLELLESNVPLGSERNLAVADIWNYEQPEVMVIMSGFSNRYWPGNFMDQTNVVQTWGSDLLYGGHYPLVIAGSCGGADFSRTEYPGLGKPVFQEMLTAPWSGASAWIGPTAGSDYRANRMVVQYLMEELLVDDDRAIGLAFRAALQRIFTDFSGDEQVLSTARSYVLLGDPLTRVGQAMVATSAETGVPQRTKLLGNYPNPFNPSTTISFSVAISSLVQLRVFDTKGRLIRTLVQDVLPAGMHQAQWNGLDDSGKQVASGLYLYSLDVDGTVSSNKMLLVK